MLRLAFTADLHLDNAKGQDANRLLLHFLHASPPDVLVLVGDLGNGGTVADCLARFADLPCRVAFVPGNHDLWVKESLPFDSLGVYQQVLPAAAERLGMHYLDAGPMVLPEHGLAIVGSVNWYDYSWSIEGLRRAYPDEEHRLQSKRFTRGRHNDANFIRWPHDDESFTRLVADNLERHLQEALARAERVIVATHHPPYYGLGIGRDGPPVALDSFLWDAFLGNARVERLLTRHADRISFAFCGHTHDERENHLGPIRGYNIGGDYNHKRLLWLTWPEGTVEAHTFGEPGGGR